MRAFGPFRGALRCEDVEQTGALFLLSCYRAGMRDLTLGSCRSIFLKAACGGLLTLTSACAAKQELTPPVYAAMPAAERDTQLPPGPRLPASVAPLRYRVGLTVDPTLAQFSGEVSIDLALDVATETIYLHAKDITASQVTLVGANGEPLSGTLEAIDKSGLAALRFKQPVGPGPVRLDITYTAPFAQGLRGLYRTQFEGKAYAFTQLEAISARLMFPSFDEPRFKTPFDVRLKVKKGDVAIANARLLERKSVDANFDEVTFATTPPLPSYLLAVAVGPFDVVDGPMLTKTALRDHDVPLRGVAAQGKGNELGHALSTTPAMVNELESYFGIAYPYDKLDLIAVPDFGSGAMENAGAITFRDTILLVKPNAAESQKRSLAYINAHELAHQWFGDLVTMPWWNDLWLNEAFASWMGQRVVSVLQPELESQLSALAYTHSAMAVDSRAATRQIRSPVNSEHDIGNAFDAITYSKGGAVLSMFESYLGKDVFRDGLRRYMKKHAFGNATAEDLVAALSEASGRPLKDAFFSFLEQPGLPLVATEVRCEGSAATLKLAQSRYAPLATALEAGSRWQIPMCVRFATQEGSREQCTLLAADQEDLKLETSSCPRWVMPNANASGYYRWSLSESALLGLVDVAPTELTSREQLSLIENIDAALRAGALKVNTALAAFEKLGTIDKRPVLEGSLEKLAFVRDGLLDDASIAAYRAFVRGLVEARYQKLGMFPAKGERDDGELKLTRALLVQAMAQTVRDEAVRKQLASLGRAQLGMETQPRLAELPAELLEPALSVAVQDGGKDVFERALTELDKTGDGVTRARLLSAISATRDPALSPRALELSLSDKLRGNELYVPLSRQAAMPETRAVAWGWVTQHVDALQAKVGDYHASFMIEVFDDLCTDEAAAELERVFGPRVEKITGAPRDLKLTLESIRSCSALRTQQAESARSFFAAAGDGKRARKADAKSTKK
jgi:alanyl aminopeptidase